MSDGQPPSAKTLSNVWGRLACLIGRCLVWFCLLVILMLFGGLLEVICAVLFGWIIFLRRVLPLVSLNGDLIGMAVVGILLLAGGAHWFLRWISGQVAKARVGETGTSLWPWKWTWCGLAALGLAFLTGSALVGVVHQAGWMMSSREPWFESKGRAAYYLEWHALERGCERIFAEPATGVDAVRERFGRRDERYLWNSRVVHQRHHILALLDDDGTVESIIFFSRDAKHREGLGAMHVAKEGRERVPADKIDEWLRSHQARLVAL